jgi:hypothetical protein
MPLVTVAVEALKMMLMGIFNPLDLKRVKKSSLANTHTL